MCTSVPKPKPMPILASTTSREGEDNSRIEARLRRLRSGAAANALTGPRGIPGKQLGAPA
jgi:hypothetical protein